MTDVAHRPVDATQERMGEHDDLLAALAALPPGQRAAVVQRATTTSSSRWRGPTGSVSGTRWPGCPTAARRSSARSSTTPTRASGGRWCSGRTARCGPCCGAARSTPAPRCPWPCGCLEGQGWVVAAYGSALRYRTAVAGPWTDAGRDAALLPDPAVEVEVTASGGAPVVVPL